MDYGVDAVVPSRSGTADEVNLLYAGSLVDLMQLGVALRSHFACDKHGSHMELSRSVRAPRTAASIPRCWGTTFVTAVEGSALSKQPNAWQRRRRALKAA